MSDRLTKRMVDRAPYPQHGQTFVWDSELKGFGLRVTPTRKTYIVQARVVGRTVRITVGPHGPLTPEQARHEAHKRLGEMAKGVNFNQERRIGKIKGVTLAQAYADYLKARKLTANTLKDYNKAMRRGFAHWVELPITRLSRVMVERRFAELSLHSPAQANQMFRFLRALLNFAMAKYLDADGNPTLSSNPCDQLSALKLWHRIERRTRYIKPHELKEWFAALGHQPEDSEHRKAIKDFCVFTLLTGCREQEAGRLRWCDVDFEGGTVIFRTTKNHRTHTLPLGPWLRELLQRRHEAQTSDYVFPADNREGHVRNHRKAILAICQSSGVEFRLHDLRRTFSTIVNHQLGRGFSAYTIKRLLNHSITDVTAGYIQHGVEDLREPMELIEKYVLRQAGLLSGDVNPAQTTALY